MKETAIKERSCAAKTFQAMAVGRSSVQRVLTIHKVLTDE